MEQAINTFLENWDNVLDQFEGTLKEESVSFGTRASMAMNAMEVSIKALAALGLLSRLEVQVCGSTADSDITWDYELSSKENDAGEQVDFIKTSKKETYRDE